MTQKDNLLVHIDALYRSALSLVKNENNADDLVQETYLKAFKFLREDKEISNEKAWLFKILINTFINQYRKDKREGLFCNTNPPSPLDENSIAFLFETLSSAFRIELKLKL